MALNALEIERISKVAIDHYVKNKPADQITVDRPLFDLLVPSAKPIPGGKEYIVENLFVSYGSNFQYWSGNGRVTYNTRNPNELVKFRYTNSHDGFTLNEDELQRAGIEINDDAGKSTATTGEALQLTNMIESQFMALREGHKEQLHAAMWLDGSQATDAIPGVDALVSTTPTVGTVGGLNAANVTYWRNYASVALASTVAAILGAMETAKRTIMRTGGRVNKIYAGGAFIDALRNALIAANQTQITYSGGTPLVIDMATQAMKFDGVTIEWVPDFDTEFGLSAPTVPWTKRCYMLDTRFFKYWKAGNDFMKMRYPGRPIDQYVYHYAMTSKFGMSIRKRNAQAVLAIT